MTTVEVFNILYEEDKINRCIISLNEIQYNASWSNGEYIVEKTSITIEQSEEKSRESINKVTQSTRERANSRQTEIKMVQENISNLKSRAGRQLKLTLKAKQAKEEREID